MFGKTFFPMVPPLVLWSPLKLFFDQFWKFLIKLQISLKPFEMFSFMEKNLTISLHRIWWNFFCRLKHLNNGKSRKAKYQSHHHVLVVLADNNIYAAGTDILLVEWHILWFYYYNGILSANTAFIIPWMLSQNFFVVGCRVIMLIELS